jgi:hypothetical protein
MSASIWINVLLAVLLLLAVIALLKCYNVKPMIDRGASGRASEALAKLDVFKRLEPIEWFAKCFYIVVACLIGVFALALAARRAQISWTALGDLLVGVSVSFAVALASTALGCLLGFLFGIPKSLQRGAAPQPQQQSASGAPSGSAKDPAAAGSGAPARTSGPAFGTNTSLEEISDWLTKIIIGLGLVQFQTFLSYLYNAAAFAASFIAQSNFTIDTTQTGKIEYHAPLASPFLFALILACLVASCLFAYLETRTRLTQLFMEQKKDEDASTSPPPFDMNFRNAGVTVDAANATLSYKDPSSEALRTYLWPGGQYDDDRRKTLNGLLAELGIDRDVRLILTGSENAGFRNDLIDLARKKGILGPPEAAPVPS